jgi:hypothetical protein
MMIALEIIKLFGNRPGEVTTLPMKVREDDSPAEVVGVGGSLDLAVTIDDIAEEEIDQTAGGYSYEF